MLKIIEKIRYSLKSIDNLIYFNIENSIRDIRYIFIKMGDHEQSDSINFLFLWLKCIWIFKYLQLLLETYVFYACE